MTDPVHTPQPSRPLGVVILGVLMAGGIVAATSQVARLTRERDELQARLLMRERQLVDLREQLTRSEVTVQEKSAAVASRDVALAEATQPQLPVQVSFRPAWMGQGMVASFHNVSDHPLTLMIEFRDPASHASKDFALAVDAGQTTDVGHPQKWLVTPGQSVRVAATGYQSVTAFAP
ncbi:MAG TPA: hypothetical protein VJQ47_17355 [Steroidobacteraceae bacterium]|nr:hypothetical protein [Steroidobacteraceae bacterium]